VGIDGVGVVTVGHRLCVVAVLVTVHEVTGGATAGLAEEGEVGGPGHVRGGHERTDETDDEEHRVVVVLGRVDDLVLREEAREERHTAQRERC
jgi:hypothetical protein